MEQIFLFAFEWTLRGYYALACGCECMRGLDDLVRAGKILYVGLSDAPAWWVPIEQTTRAEPVVELRHEQQSTSIASNWVIASSLGAGTPRNAGRREGDRRRDAL
jgi:hypothetical protein